MHPTMSRTLSMLKGLFEHAGYTWICIEINAAEDEILVTDQRYYATGEAVLFADRDGHTPQRMPIAKFVEGNGVFGIDSSRGVFMVYSPTYAPHPDPRAMALDILGRVAHYVGRRYLDTEGRGL
jgi:hypothetical protein